MTSEVARLLGKSAEAVRYYEKIGRLPSLRTAAGIRLFRREEVDRFAATFQRTRREETDGS